MARIRTIKPEFFTSESVLSVTPLARLLFIGLWCEADRDGRLKWKPKTLKFRYLPADNVDMESICGELEAEGMIITYCVGDIDYCEIPSFSNHQVINNRERESIIPSRVNHASTTRESGRKEGRERKEGKGREGEDTMSDSSESDQKPVIRNSVPYEQINNLYTTILVETGDSGLALVDMQKLTTKRKASIKKYWTREGKHGIERLEGYFQWLWNNKDQHSWVFGANDRGWKADIEYLLREDTIAKALEGRLGNFKGN